MKPPKLIGKTKSNAIHLGPGALGAPGSWLQLTIQPTYHSNRFEGKDRFGDVTLRKFQCTAQLTRSPVAVGDLNVDGEAEAGGSFILGAGPSSKLELHTPDGGFLLETNKRGEVSVIRSVVEANSAVEARVKFENSLALFCDHLSFTMAVPIFVANTAVRDRTNEMTYVYLQSPPLPAEFPQSFTEFYVEMRPVYALYREFSNSSSPYYRLLCLFKIMEGLLGPLRANLLRAAKAAGRRIEIKKAVVPDHDDLADDVREYVGMPMKEFCDNVLQHDYRDAVGHFELSKKRTRRLLVSEAEEAIRFSNIVFMADLAVRNLIGQHEDLLRQLHADRRLSDDAARGGDT